MAATLADAIIKCNFANKNFEKNFTELCSFLPTGLIENKWSLFQVMVSRRTGDKPLHEPRMTHFNDTSPGLNELNVYRKLWKFHGGWIAMV